LTELDGKQISEISAKVAQDEQKKLSSKNTTPLKSGTIQSITPKSQIFSSRKSSENPTQLRLTNEFQINSLKEIIKDQEELIRANISEEATKNLLFAWQKKVFEMVFEKQKNELNMIEWKKQQALAQEKILIEAENKFGGEIGMLKGELEQANSKITELQKKEETITNQLYSKIKEQEQQKINIRQLIEERITFANESFAKLGKNCDQEFTNLNNKFTKLGSELEKVEKQKNQFDSEKIRSLEHEIENEKQKNINLGKEKEQILNDKQKLEGELSKIKLESELVQIEIQKIQVKLVESENNLSKLKSDILIKDKEINEKIKSLENEKENSIKYQNESNEWHKKYNDLLEKEGKEANLLNEKYNKLIAENTQQMRKIETLEKDIKYLTDSHNSELAEMELENRVQLKDRDAKIKTLKAERDSLLQKLNEIKRASRTSTPILEPPLPEHPTNPIPEETKKPILQPSPKPEKSHEISKKILTSKLVTTINQSIKSQFPNKTANIQSKPEQKNVELEKKSEENEEESFQEPPPSARLIRKLEGIEKTAMDALEDL